MRLPFLDGLRGLAALTVVGCHCVLSIPFDDRPVAFANVAAGSFAAATTLQRAVWPLLFGTHAVVLFVMLSGFGLYHSEQRRRARGSPSTLSAFARRRAFRILPMYFAAIAFSLLVLAVVPSARELAGTPMNRALPITARGLLTHVFLVQDLWPEHLFEINPPLWSLAVEAKLYVLFPCLLLVATRSPLFATGAAMTLAFAAHRLHSATWLFLAVWFLAGPFVYEIAARVRISYAIPLASGLVLTTCAALLGPMDPPRIWLWLPAFGLTLWGLAGAPDRRWNVLGVAPVQTLGAWSYALYAVHAPVLLALAPWVRRLPLAKETKVGIMLGVGVPASLLAAWLFYVLVDRWALRRARNAP